MTLSSFAYEKRDKQKNYTVSQKKWKQEISKGQKTNTL